MWRSIMHDLKGSTLGEKILLGIIAAILATVGFYLGYAQLSNGVNSLTVGIIVAFAVMVGGIALSFIVDEIIKALFPRFREEDGYYATLEANKEKEDSEDGIDSSKGKDSTTDEMDTKDTQTEDSTVNSDTNDNNDSNGDFDVQEFNDPALSQVAKKNKIKRVSPFKKKQEVAEDIEPVEIQAADEKAPLMIMIDETNVIAKGENTVKSDEEKARLAEVSKIVGDIARIGRENGANLLMTNSHPEVSLPDLDSTKQDEVETTNDDVDQEKGLSLVDFIKAHPTYPPRKIIREYTAAGGTESTHNILELMG